MEQSNKPKKKLIVVVVLIAVVGLGIAGVVLGFFPRSHDQGTIAAETALHEEPDHGTPAGSEMAATAPSSAIDKKSKTAKPPAPSPVVIAEHAAPSPTMHTQPLVLGAAPTPSAPPGVTFVTAAITPLDYELNERFWGWRPNDILDFTDNVNNYQLGVLEVTRRTVERLAENISRTGSTAAFDKHLEHARSTCFVISAERYMFPSPEGKYREGLEDLEKYREKLENGSGVFYTRADNIIPLLMEYEHLLGSCDDNLVKMVEDNGEAVSFFDADDYFYYAQGVAAAMSTMLKAIERDFHTTLDRRNCLPVIHHAIESCDHATHIKPIIILDRDLDSIFANHRANMAAHISHARFYVGVLVKTLST